MKRLSALTKLERNYQESAETVEGGWEDEHRSISLPTKSSRKGNTKPLFENYRSLKRSGIPTDMMREPKATGTEKGQSIFFANFSCSLYVKTSTFEELEKHSDPLHHRIVSKTEISEDMMKSICSALDTTKIKSLSAKQLENLAPIFSSFLQSCQTGIFPHQLKPSLI